MFLSLCFSKLLKANLNLSCGLYNSFPVSSLQRLDASRLLGRVPSTACCGSGVSWQQIIISLSDNLRVWGREGCGLWFQETLTLGSCCLTAQSCSSESPEPQEGPPQPFHPCSSLLAQVSAAHHYHSARLGRLPPLTEN